MSRGLDQDQQDDDSDHGNTKRHISIGAVSPNISTLYAATFVRKGKVSLEIPHDDLTKKSGDFRPQLWSPEAVKTKARSRNRGPQYNVQILTAPRHHGCKNFRQGDQGLYGQM